MVVEVVPSSQRAAEVCRLYQVNALRVQSIEFLHDISTFHVFKALDLLISVILHVLLDALNDFCRRYSDVLDWLADLGYRKAFLLKALKNVVTPASRNVRDIRKLSCCRNASGKKRCPYLHFVQVQREVTP